ncbi:MAG: DNA double-strand break repair nuclease NurA [Nitrososphaeria archaeon]
MEVENHETLEEFEFRADWARKQFNEMQSDVAIRLLESALTKGNNLQTFLNDRRKVASELGLTLIKKGIIRTVKEDDKVYEGYRDALAIGIDSSRQLPLKVLSMYYCPITSAVVFFDGISSKMQYDDEAPCKFFEENDITPEEALRKTEEEMYKCEVSAITRVSSIINRLSQHIGNKKKVLVMIDGPIVDPPNKPLYTGYIRERANAILACKEAGALVIGCVKRLEGHHFLNFLKQDTSLSDLAAVAEGFGSDSQLIPFLFLSLRSLGSLLQTIPIEVSEHRSLIEKYKNCGIDQIYRTYLSLGGRTAPLCVEYFATKGENVTEMWNCVCQAVRAWTMPGLSVPLPVLAAHLRCNVKRGAAEFLYRQILTRGLSWEGGAEMFRVLTGSD